MNNIEKEQNKKVARKIQTLFKKAEWSLSKVNLIRDPAVLMWWLNHTLRWTSFDEKKRKNTMYILFLVCRR